jgi:organic hydroperoxide reductase OsmC/OhrA
VDPERFEIRLERKQGYQLQVDFQQPGIAPLLMDEPPPLGDGQGPKASQVLAAAVGNCLTASLLFCLGKSRVEVLGLTTTVGVTMERNERGKKRIAGIDVTIHPEVAPGDADRLARCRELFEDFCVVSASVRQGIDVKVAVEPAGR